MGVVIAAAFSPRLNAAWSTSLLSMASKVGYQALVVSSFFFICVEHSVRSVFVIPRPGPAYNVIARF
jgi:hypothetical protein